MTVLLTREAIALQLASRARGIGATDSPEAGSSHFAWRKCHRSNGAGIRSFPVRAIIFRQRPREVAYARASL